MTRRHYCPIANLGGYPVQARIAACGAYCADASEGTSRLVYVRCRACVAAVRTLAEVLGLRPCEDPDFRCDVRDEPEAPHCKRRAVAVEVEPYTPAAFEILCCREHSMGFARRPL